jgi:DNA-binding MarR family transcriptional regulator
LPPSPRAAADLVDALATTAPLTTRWIERLLATASPPLTVSQYLGLRAIASERVSAVDLARRAGVSGAAVSQLVSGLESAGLVARSPEPGDRRRQSLELTAGGRGALESAATVLRTQLGPLLSDLPKPEAAALAGLLVRVEAALGGAPPPRRPPRPAPPPPPEGRPRPPR